MDIKSFNINNLDWLCWQSLQFGEMQGEDPVRAHKQKGAAEVGHREDPDLLSRCGDLLIASYNFDRAINQATLVLEDRIRKKAQPPSSSGETLSLRSLGGEPAPIGGAIPGFWRTLWQVWRETKIYD
jgi:hypothetical protein